ncbi:hypothetical protein VFPPC_12708 [Pochonia chlamydosporia 170]|uniref:Uncharacterized protein n=1 Tax=Pochonia chlamydosporia 170 TaxID=1380566 RepID=A0A179G452_METCM|nr:hypothetical protein VFPPC_12708 [Pochonia chlamydosporia 170]OAQ72141.1 hypothetical protein VFPPC_12708 [Pochonia chlamydosporia 170]
MHFNLAILANVLAATSALAIRVRLYDGPNGSGANKEYNFPAGSCVDLGNLQPPPGKPANYWNDRVSSFWKESGHACTFYL